MIDVDDGTCDTSDEVRQWVEKKHIPFAVFYDTDRKMCDLYQVASYPAQYLIGRDGKVVWQGHGYADDDPVAIEGEIRKALARQ